MNVAPDPSVDYFVAELAEALSRIEYDIRALCEHENNWVQDPVDGMYVFDGYLHPFLVKKYSTDLVREAWHIYDGALQLLNAKWKAGQVNVIATSLDGGKGPGKAIVDKQVKSCRWIQLCGDLANLTKHYRIERATKTGDSPPQIGDSLFSATLVGKFEVLKDEKGHRQIRVERPVPFRPTLAVLDDQGKKIGDIVDIALHARDSWVEFLGRCGVVFTTPVESLPIETGFISANVPT